MGVGLAVLSGATRGSHQWDKGSEGNGEGPDDIVVQPPTSLTAFSIPNVCLFPTSISHRSGYLRSYLLPENKMAAVAIEVPAGGTYLDTFKKSFTDVPVDAANDNAISTEEFLEAAESLVTIFGQCEITYRGRLC